MVFLNQWNDARHPEYDFDTNELVYRDVSGKEVQRAALGGPINGAQAPLNQPPVSATKAAPAALLRPLGETLTPRSGL